MKTGNTKRKCLHACVGKKKMKSVFLAEWHYVARK